MIADLHTHTSCSDGSLAPAALLAGAQAAGIELLAVTDHDTLAAYATLAPGRHGALRLVSGVELSTRWRRRDIHVVGLNFDLDEPDLARALARQQAARVDRARRIARRLARLGVADALAGAREIAGSAHIGRPHFAEHLVRAGFVRDAAEAFRKYLGAGKPGDVRSDWMPMEEGVALLRGAGGSAVLAHPAKYRMTRTRLGALVAAFADCGGDAMEVVTGHQADAVTGQLAALAMRHGLSASCGSDFHSADQPWAALGRATPLPARCTPVWSGW